MRRGTGCKRCRRHIGKYGVCKIKIIQYTNLCRATAKRASFDCPMCTNRIVSFCLIIKHICREKRVHQLFLILP